LPVFGPSDAHGMVITSGTSTARCTVFGGGAGERGAFFMRFFMKLRSKILPRRPGARRSRRPVVVVEAGPRTTVEQLRGGSWGKPANQAFAQLVGVPGLSRGVEL